MSHDRIAATHNLCIVTALIEHPHIKSQYVGKVYSAAHTALIRADHHHMVTVDLQFLLFSQKILDKLVNRLNRLKSL